MDAGGDAGGNTHEQAKIYVSQVGCGIADGVKQHIFKAIVAALDRIIALRFKQIDKQPDIEKTNTTHSVANAAISTVKR